MSNGMHQRPRMLNIALVGGLLAGLATKGMGVIDRVLERMAPPDEAIPGSRRNRARRMAHAGQAGVAAAKCAKRRRRNIAKNPRGSA